MFQRRHPSQVEVLGGGNAAILRRTAFYLKKEHGRYYVADEAGLVEDQERTAEKKQLKTLH